MNDRWRHQERVQGSVEVTAALWGARSRFAKKPELVSAPNMNSCAAGWTGRLAVFAGTAKAGGSQRKARRTAERTKDCRSESARAKAQKQKWQQKTAALSCPGGAVAFTRSPDGNAQPQAPTAQKGKNQPGLRQAVLQATNCVPSLPPVRKKLGINAPLVRGGQTRTQKRGSRSGDNRLTDAVFAPTERSAKQKYS